MAESITMDTITDPNLDEAEAALQAKMIEVAEKGVTAITSKDSRTPEANVDLRSEQTGDEGEEPEAEPKAERPDDIPEKFWDDEKGEVNVAALLKSQQDAEAALRRQQSGEKPNEGDQVEKTEEGEGDTPKPQDVADRAAAEFAEKGELSEDMYAELAEAGYSRDLVDGHIQGQNALRDNLRNAAFSNFDEGQEGYTKAADWARSNMSEGELAALNVQLTSTDPAVVKVGAKALADRYSAEADVTPNRRVDGNRAASGSAAGFKSSAEMVKAMSDPRYKTDLAYQKEVANKIESAAKSGVDLFN